MLASLVVGSLRSSSILDQNDYLRIIHSRQTLPKPDKDNQSTASFHGALKHGTGLRCRPVKTQICTKRTKSTNENLPKEII